MFGGTPGRRWCYTATDLPGIHFNFSGNPNLYAPTRGRMLDHIGFEVVNLEAFCDQLTEKGVELDVPYAESPLGFGTAFLTDPWARTSS